MGGIGKEEKKARKRKENADKKEKVGMTKRGHHLLMMEDVSNSSETSVPPLSTN